MPRARMMSESTQGSRQRSDSGFETMYIGSKRTLRLRRNASGPEVLRARSSGLGPLETKLLEFLWAQAHAVTVRDAQIALPELAYTTIMTTLDRLHRKGLLVRHKDDRAFAYRPRCTRDEMLSELASGHLTDLLRASQRSTIVLSRLVRAVGGTDAALLDELDALLQAERLRLRRVK
jgi:predicted transcriptional regulator